MLDIKAPIDSRLQNLLESMDIPNTYWEKKSETYKYWFRSLLQKIDSALIFKGLPEGWNEDFFHLCLWVRGYVCVFKTNRNDLAQYGKDGIVFQPCTVSGFDFYYQPKKAVVSNPYYTATMTIGKTAELLKLTPDFRGVLDIIDFYADKLARVTKGIDMGLETCLYPLILSAKNEAQANTLKAIYDKAQKGESLIVWKNVDDSDEVMPVKDAFEQWTNDYQKTYVVHNLLDDMQEILNSFYTEIGLPVAIEKKERLVTSEADFASAQSQARIACWVETLEESLEIINKHYGTKIEVEYAHETDTNGNGKRTEQSDSE